MTKEELKRAIDSLPDDAVEQFIFRVRNDREERWWLPKVAQQQIGIEAGMMFIVRQAENGDLYLQREQDAEVIEKDGFLIVRSPLGDSIDLVEQKRDVRMGQMLIKSSH